MKSITTKSVVFITGAFVSHSGWDRWRTYFERKGYNTIAPSWPYKNASAFASYGRFYNIIPVSINRRNAKAYKANDSVVDFKEFEGRNHFVLGQPSWKEDANYILDWIYNN